MTIDKSGDAWTSPLVADIAPYLVELAIEEGTPPIHEFRLARCACGSLEFALMADPDEGCAQRTCKACKKSHIICDGAEYWDACSPGKLICPVCQSDTFNLGAGFCVRAKGPDVRWIAIGERCVKCGALGSFIDWKIDYTPSMHLLDQV